MTLHHLSFATRDIRRSSAFYDAVLGALGYVRVWEDIDDADPQSAVGYGHPGGDDKLALKWRADQEIKPYLGFCLSFAARDRASVDRFHEAALQLGGTDTGQPALQVRLGANRYTASVIDLDGYRIEAVCPAS